MSSHASPRHGLRPWMMGLLIGAAIVLASCFPECLDIVEVGDLGISQETLYAVFGPQTVYASVDFGETWVATDAGIPSSMSKPNCGADGTCFRINDVTIERSNSGGDWERVWTIPSERSEYVSRTALCSDDTQTGSMMYFTTDPIAVDTPDGTAGVVGMGDQGVVVVSDDGVSRLGVGPAKPTPFVGWSGVGSQFWEVAFLGLLGFLVMWAVGPLRSAAYLALGWVVAVFAPYVLWARGVFDSYDGVNGVAVWMGGIGAGVLLVVQLLITRYGPIPESADGDP